MKHVEDAEKAEAKYAKVCDPNSTRFLNLVTPPKAVDKAIHVHDKATRKAHKMAGKLAKAERAHDSAAHHVQDADRAIQVRSEAYRRYLLDLTAATA